MFKLFLFNVQNIILKWNFENILTGIFWKLEEDRTILSENKKKRGFSLSENLYFKEILCLKWFENKELVNNYKFCKKSTGEKSNYF